MDSRDAPLSLPQSGATIGLVLCALLTLGASVQARWPLAGLAATEIVLVLLPVLLAVFATRSSLAAALGARRAAPAAFAGAALAGLGAWVFVEVIVAATQQRLFPMPRARVAGYQHLIAPAHARPFLLDLVVLALLPALCEEVLFRGLLFRSLRARLPAGASITIAAAAFAALHLDPWKLLPTFLLGLLLGAIVEWSGSLFPAVAFHAVNNAVVVALARLQSVTGATGGGPLPELSHRAAAIVVAVGPLVAFMGLALVRRAGYLRRGEGT